MGSDPIMKLLLIIIFLFQFTWSASAEKYKPSTFVFPPFWATLGFHKVTQTEVSIFMRGTRIDSLEGIAAVKLKSQDDPETESDDDELTGYAVDSINNSLAYNPTFISAVLYPKHDITPTTFNQPHGIDATPEGDVWVADTGNKRVALLFNNNGKVSYVDSYYGFEEPYDVSHNKQRHIFVTDRKANIIKIYNKDREHIRTIRHTKIKNPTAIEVVDSRDIWHFYKEDFIVLVNNNGKELLKLTPQGSLTTSLDISKLLNKEVKLEYLTVDYYSQVLVTDSKNSTIYKFDRDLNYITSYGRYGTDDYEFIEPKGIDIWRRYGQMFVIEKTGGQYYWVGTDIKNFKVFKAGHRLEIRFFLTEPALVTLELYKGRKMIRQFMKERRIYEYENSYSFIWREPQDKKRKKKTKYKLKITAVPTYSARTIFKKILTKEIRN